MIVDLDLQSQVPQHVVVIVGNKRSTMSVKAICRCHLGALRACLGSPEIRLAEHEVGQKTFQAVWYCVFSCSENQILNLLHFCSNALPLEPSLKVKVFLLLETTK